MKCGEGKNKKKIRKKKKKKENGRKVIFSVRIL